jgi:hypothetical protein
MRVLIETRDARGRSYGRDLLCEPHARELVQRVAPAARWPQPWEHSTRTWNTRRTEQVEIRVIADSEQPCERCQPSDADPVGALESVGA